jgi:hypothetical protein
MNIRLGAVVTATMDIRKERLPMDMGRIKSMIDSCNVDEKIEIVQFLEKETLPILGSDT